MIAIYSYEVDFENGVTMLPPGSAGDLCRAVHLNRIEGMTEQDVHFQKAEIFV
jgi:hypothetical protein